jgi:hypothetical protein
MRGGENLKRQLLIFFIIFILFSGSLSVFALETFFTETDEFNNLRLGNDYVVIVTNKDENGQGRFAIETTGGDPLRNNDDNKPLVYGRPKPWTSYTTIWLNEDLYVFGGSTGRRAGKTGLYGDIVYPPYVKEGSIYTTTRINDQIQIEQILTIVKSSTTGLYDSVQIEYRVENISQEIQKVGLRIMLDTMLGQNDGAPFRIGNDVVTVDKLYYKKQLPAFWQAFDTISNPSVTSQGSFIGAGLTPPDQVYLADWGSLADEVWNFDFNPGEDFLRKGEYEIDSAIAIYWVPQLLKPGETRSYITNYGLGGITIVPGLLSLGVTSPAEVTFDTPEKSFPIIAYVENTSEITAKDVKIKLDLPDYLTAQGKERNLGDLESGGIAQVVWNIQLSGRLPQKTKYMVKVEAKNTDSNQVVREIKFVGPPELTTNLRMIDQLRVEKGRLLPNPFKIEANISNTGGSTLYDVSTELLPLPPGLTMASKERARKYPGDIQAGETVRVLWQIEALEVEEGSLPLLAIAVDIRALHGYNEVARFDNLEIPELKPLLYLDLIKIGDLKVNDYISVDIVAENINYDKMDLILQYDPVYLKPVHVLPGNLFVKEYKSQEYKLLPLELVLQYDPIYLKTNQILPRNLSVTEYKPREYKLLPWNRPDLSEEGLIKIQQTLPTEKSRGKVATIRFKVLKTGESQIKWGETGFKDQENHEVEVYLD